MFKAPTEWVNGLSVAGKSLSKYAPEECDVSG